jgi:hypothetical protein
MQSKWPKYFRGFCLIYVMSTGHVSYGDRLPSLSQPCQSSWSDNASDYNSTIDRVPTPRQSATMTFGSSFFGNQYRRRRRRNRNGHAVTWLSEPTVRNEVRSRWHPTSWQGHVPNLEWFRKQGSGLPARNYSSLKRLRKISEFLFPVRHILVRNPRDSSKLYKACVISYYFVM